MADLGRTSIYGDLNMRDNRIANVREIASSGELSLIGPIGIDGTLFVSGDTAIGGRVGINVSGVEDTSLYVVGVSNAEPIARFERASGGNGTIEFWADNTNNYIIAGDSKNTNYKPLRIETKGNTNIQLRPGGGLDIYGNTQIHSSTLTVGGAASVSGLLTLGTQATGTGHAVRADRTISTGSSLTGGGNLTDNRTLNTIQDIRTSATPEFSGLIVSGAGTIESRGTGVNREDILKLYGYSTTHYLSLDYAIKTGTTYTFQIKNGGNTRHLEFLNHDNSLWLGLNAGDGSARFGGKVHIGEQATGAAHAVRADRTIALNLGSSLSRSSGSASQNLTGNVAWTINTIQDIRKTASPEFSGLILQHNTLTPVNVTFEEQSNGGLRLANSHGYVSITPQNSGWAHIYTDRDRFIFNKEVQVVGGIISAYNNTDLKLATGAEQERARITTGGNFGVGLTGPASRIHALSPDATILTLDRDSETTNVGIHLKNKLGSIHVGADLTASQKYFAIGPTNNLNNASTFRVNAATGDTEVSGDIIPEGNYSGNIGLPTRKWLSLHAAELLVETLVADERRVTMGGRLTVGHSTVIGRVRTSSGRYNYIDVTHNNLNAGDNLHLEKDGNVEFMRVVSHANNGNEVTIDGVKHYQYRVERATHHTGSYTEDLWGPGDAVFNTGTTGHGHIDLYARNALTDLADNPLIQGPTIAFNVRTGTAWNAIKTFAAAGNLKGIPTDSFGTLGDEYGLYGQNVYLEGAIVAKSGLVGGWDIADGRISSGTTSDSIQLLQDNKNTIGPTLYTGTPAGVATISLIHGSGTANRTFVHLGETYSSGWTGRYGISATQSKSGAAIFEISQTIGGTDQTAHIAGWNFDTQNLWTGTKQTSDAYTSSGITISSAGAIRAKNFRIDTGGNAYFRGDITGASGTFSGVMSIGSGDSFFKASTDGIQLGHETFASAPFRVTPKGALTATSGAIGGWTLGATTLTGGNVILSSAGTIRVGSLSSITGSAAGTFIDNSGNFASWGNANNFIRRNGSSLVIQSSSFTLKAGSGTSEIGAASGTGFWAGGTSSAAPFRVTTAGALYASNATISGSIDAGNNSRIAGTYLTNTAMWAGNATIGHANTRFVLKGLTGTSPSFAIAHTAADAMTATSTNRRGFYADGSGNVNMVASSSAFIRIDTNGLRIETPQLKLTAAGNATFSGTLSAASGDFEGKVTANDGEIGGWTINSNSIESGTTGSIIGMKRAGSGTFGFYAGATSSGGTGAKAVIKHDGSGYLGASDKFFWDTSGNVTLSGKITATDGAIGGWTIASNRIHAGSSSSFIGMSSSSSHPAFFAGATSNVGANAKISLMRDGSGHIAGGNLSWSNGGDLRVKGALETFGPGDSGPGNLLAGLTPSGSSSSAVVTDGHKAISTSSSQYASFGSAVASVGSGSGDESGYVHFDLGKVKRIAFSRIYFFAGDDRHYWYKIKYSRDNTNWFYAVGNDENDGWVASQPRPSGFTTGDIHPTIDILSPAISARYVRLYANGSTSNRSNHIYEWELYSSMPTDLELSAINAKAGTIGGWEISAGTLSSGNITLSTESNGRIEINNAGITGNGTSNGSVRFWSGNAYSSRGSAPFRVTRDGSLVATKATITGAITATSGTFSGTVNASGGSFTGYVSGGTARFGKGVTSGNDGIWLNNNNYWYSTGNFRVGGTNGINYSGSGNVKIGSGVEVNGDISGATGTFTGALSVGSNFSVNSSGSVTASAGKVGGWTISGDSISSGNVSISTENSGRIEVGNAGMTGNGTSNSSVKIWAGGAYSGRASAAFRVTRNGSLTATNANITGTVNATDGSFTGTINASSGIIGESDDTYKILLGTHQRASNAIIIGRMTSGTGSQQLSHPPGIRLYGSDTSQSIEMRVQAHPFDNNIRLPMFSINNGNNWIRFNQTPSRFLQIRRGSQDLLTVSDEGAQIAGFRIDNNEIAAETDQGAVAIEASGRFTASNANGDLIFDSASGISAASNMFRVLETQTGTTNVSTSSYTSVLRTIYTPVEGDDYIVFAFRGWCSSSATPAQVRVTLRTFNGRSNSTTLISTSSVKNFGDGYGETTTRLMADTAFVSVSIPTHLRGRIIQIDGEASYLSGPGSTTVTIGNMKLIACTKACRDANFSIDKMSWEHAPSVPNPPPLPTTTMRLYRQAHGSQTSFSQTTAINHSPSDNNSTSTSIHPGNGPVEKAFKTGRTVTFTAPEKNAPGSPYELIFDHWSIGSAGALKHYGRTLTVTIPSSSNDSRNLTVHYRRVADNRLPIEIVEPT